ASGLWDYDPSSRMCLQSWGEASSSFTAAGQFHASFILVVQTLYPSFVAALSFRTKHPHDNHHNTRWALLFQACSSFQ
uniref:Uncharacterized protein n=1 Tax=Aegilops tauschii subsp. strangulata TaxID=200361 RepID=A0A452ZJG3_AEGTS